MAGKTVRKVSKTKSKNRAKVVVNSKPRGLTASLQNRRTALFMVLVFIVVGLGVFLWARAATTTYSLWSTAAVPKTISDSDSQSVELGVKFRSQYSGQVTGVRFYKGPLNTGTHVGNLWDSTGRKLASVTFANETASGWQTAYFAQPVNISANTLYTVSYFAPSGHYSVDEGYFVNSRTNGPLTAPRRGNGVYAYAAQSIFPKNSYHSSNYWVDVLFSTKWLSPTPAPLPPSSLTATVSGTSIALAWSPSPSSGIARYELFRDSVLLKSDITGFAFTDSGLTAGTTYSYKVRAVDEGGQQSAFSNTVSATIPTAPAPAPAPTPPPLPPSGTTTCPLPKYPIATCTGVPNGTTFTTYSGDMVVTTPGKVIDGMYITGTVDVRADNVLIRNSYIEGGVVNDNTATRYSFTIEDSTVGKVSSQDQIVCSNWGNGAIGVANYTARRVRVYGFPDGFRVAGSNVLIEDSYVTLCSNSPDDHSDGIQAYGAADATNITIRHNTIDQLPVNNGGATAPIFVPVGPNQGNDNITVNVMDNLLAGGGFTLRVFTDTDSPFSAPQVTGNKIVDQSWEYGPLDITCKYIGTWSGNAVVNFDWNTGAILSQVRALNDC